MVAKKRAKRKSPSKGFVFEVNDEDVSSDSDCNEPESKQIKTDTDFVESVVNALSNLENEEKDPPKAEDVIIGCITPDLEFDDPPEAGKDLEEGEIDIEDKQTIQIKFSSEELSRLYKDKVLKFFTSFVELEIVKEEELTIILSKDTKEWRIIDETTEKSPTKKKKKKKSKKAKELFVLDTTPSQNETAGCSKYLSKFNIDLNDTTEEEIKVSNQSCFNCDQNHSIKDCPLPRDYAKINLMRQKFKKDKQTSRYHLEEEQKYSHLTPGKLSDKLREALGLKKDQLPPYVYQMRTLGYPPGWLEEAKFVYSNLSLFDTEGNNVRPENVSKNQGLDPAKIVEYPGFNIPMENKCKDEFRQYRVPPYSENYSKKAMIEYFEKEYSKQQDDLETKDMDIDANEDIPKEKLFSQQISSINSLVDLETQKETLLAALDDSSNFKSEHSGPPLPDEEEPLPPGEEPLPPPEDEPLLSVDEALAEMFPDKTKEPILRAKEVLTSSFGTPIIKSSSPYSTLPNPDNFMKDVSPVINFENLPNSTGKYEKMTGLLQKVRNTMKGLQKNDDSS